MRNIIINNNDAADNSAEYRLISHVTDDNFNNLVCPMANNFNMTISDILTLYAAKLFSAKSYFLNGDSKIAEDSDDFPIQFNQISALIGPELLLQLHDNQNKLDVEHCPSTFQKQIPSTNQYNWYTAAWTSLITDLITPELSAGCWKIINPLIKNISLHDIFHNINNKDKTYTQQNYIDDIKHIFNDFPLSLPYSFSAYDFNKLILDNISNISINESIAMPFMKYVDTISEFLFGSKTNLIYEYFTYTNIGQYVFERDNLASNETQQILSVGLDYDYKYEYDDDYDLTDNNRPYAWQDRGIRWIDGFASDSNQSNYIQILSPRLPKRLIWENLQSLSKIAYDFYMTNPEVTAVTSCDFIVEHDKKINTAEIIYRGNAKITDNETGILSAICEVNITSNDWISCDMTKEHNKFKAKRSTQYEINPLLSNVYFYTGYNYFGDRNEIFTPFESSNELLNYKDTSWKWLSHVSSDMQGTSEDIVFSENPGISSEYLDVCKYYQEYKEELLSLFPEDGEQKKQNMLSALQLDYEHQKSQYETDLHTAYETKTNFEQQYDNPSNEQEYKDILDTIKFIEQQCLPDLEQWYIDELAKIEEMNFSTKIPEYTAETIFDSKLFWWDSDSSTNDIQFELCTTIHTEVQVPKQRSNEDETFDLSSYIHRNYPNTSYPIKEFLNDVSAFHYYISKMDYSLSSDRSIDIKNIKFDEYECLSKSGEYNFYDYLLEHKTALENTIEYDGDGNKFTKSLNELTKFSSADIKLELKKAKSRNMYIPYFKDEGWNAKMHMPDGSIRIFRVLRIVMALAGTSYDEIEWDNGIYNYNLASYSCSSPEGEIEFTVSDMSNQNILWSKDQLISIIPTDQHVTINVAPIIFATADYTNLAQKFK